ncbi:MAG TPA: response regulator [Candidatus Tectomicrobia bacterium]|nr:response regulator [Candidatus Tectomicrobia bacterium]
MMHPQIMVVEDESIVAEDMKAMLEGFGYTVAAVAFSGEDAVRKALDIHPDLVLMDIVLKGKMSGVEAVERIRSRCDIPVVYVTAYADEKTVRRAKATEPFGYILKPFDARELQTAIEIALYKHQMEKKLQESEQRLSITLRSIGDAVIVMDTRGCITFMNPRAEALSGWKQAEALGRRVTEVLRVRHESLPAPPESPFLRALHEGVTVDLADRHLLLVAKDATERPIDDSAAPLKDDRGDVIGAVLVLRDITERRQLQEQLVQAQKMEAIGRLAGGLAHDFNNLLTVISVYTELLLSRRSRHDQLERYAGEIKKAVDNATTLTSQLLTLSRRQMLQPRVLDLNAAIARLEGTLQQMVGEAIELVIVPGPALGVVRIDATQLDQVVVNLVMNACDAMPQGGMLTIETSNLDLGEQQARRFAGCTAGSYVQLAVRDTGCGMDATTRSRLFEPFFTTKSRGRGTGLGLSIVYGLISQSGGHIEVDSTPGQGTVFKIYLPQVEMPSVQKPNASTAKSPQGTETVLLVEDEEEVRAAVSESLQMRGYTVLRARHGKEAVMICRRHVGPIHLLLTDVVMPQMTGLELAQRVFPLRPEIKVLYISGYTSDALAQRRMMAAGTAFLQKPFTPDALVYQVRAVLDTPPHARTPRADP